MSFTDNNSAVPVGAAESGQIGAGRNRQIDNEPIIESGQSASVVAPGYQSAGNIASVVAPQSAAGSIASESGAAGNNVANNMISSAASNNVANNNNVPTLFGSNSNNNVPTLGGSPTAPTNNYSYGGSAGSTAKTNDDILAELKRSKYPIDAQVE